MDFNCTPSTPSIHISPTTRQAKTTRSPISSNISASPRSLTRDTTALQQSFPTRHKAAVPIPMAINARPQSPPPPLPPPANVEELGRLNTESKWIFNAPNWQGFGPGQSERPDSLTVHGSLRKSPSGGFHEQHEIDPTTMRKPSTITITPAQYRDSQDMERSRTPSDEVHPSNSLHSRLHSERQLELRSLETNSQAYDRGMLSRIGTNTPLRLSSLSSTASGDMESPAHSDGRPAPIKRLSMPERRRSSNDSRFSYRNDSNASESMLSFRSNSIFSEGPRPSVRRYASYDRSQRGSHDSNMSAPDEYGLPELNINDRSPGASDDSMGTRAGMKRRASSPQREGLRLDRASVGSAPGIHDLYHRRSLQQLPPRSDPNSRYHQSSVSSVSSLGIRTASLSSSQSLSVASSVTSLASGGHLSPSMLSPALDPELYPQFPLSKSLNPSPRSSVSTQAYNRHSIDATGHVNPNSTGLADSTSHSSATPGMLICDCCPKKPRKFYTEEDLRLHHLEKQYSCEYCPNRFKNRNEMTRHISSLHLRSQSWCCAALPGVEHAFHPATSEYNSPDVCGYCGEEFPSPADWDRRRHHLSTIHKFGECNQVKKFFRADHFRQHLKHSHAGTSGKWTNVLENACMREEPPPVPMNRLGGQGGYGTAASSGVQGGGMVSTAPAQGGKPETINEVPQER